MLGEHRQCVLGDVSAAVVEGQPNRALGHASGPEQGADLRDVEHRVALGCEVLHLLAEAPRGNGELVAIVCNTVVEEHPHALLECGRARSRAPRSRPGACQRRLQRVWDGWYTHAATPVGRNVLRGLGPDMTERLDVAILGAGPYGLSVAAQLRDRCRVRTYGEPMQTWRTRMPPDMRLRSDWNETAFSAPGDAGTFDRWAAATDEPREEPIPLQKFLRYSDWFRTSFVGDIDTADVAAVERANGGFRLTTETGDEVDVRTLVVAVGAVPFAAAPAPFDGEIGDDVRFATDLQDYGAYESRRVVVVGGGQGGLESALLASRAGADVQMVVRSQLHWFAESRAPQRP